MTIPGPLPLLLSVVLAALFSACTIWAIRPLLARYALARLNPRSSHRVPTPQGAGIAVIGATLVIAGVVIACSGSVDLRIAMAVFVATLFIAAVGFADDIKPIPVIPRLTLQALAVGAVLFATPGDLRIIPACPLWIERGLLLLAGLWFVNLVNFMDGLDWMTVAEVVPITAALVLLGSLGELSPSATIVAASLGGAMIGFAPFNRPVAKVFLGDVGSLPIGLLLGWCLLELIQRQHLAAALLLPLYYLADATVTLLRRAAKREPVWSAHRSHFYQRATDNGFTVLRVVSEVFVLNIGLAALAIVSILSRSWAADTFFSMLGGLAVMFVMARFSRRR
jgi:UDP-N-acetylmuramyl pentapeptide phosphotransferase/UDP-N-acetylglucosamine-1-phosphate transferase